MKIVIVGATSLGARTARKLVEAGHDVVVIDSDRARLDVVAEGLDCGFLQGDGTHPSVLRNAAGDGADALLALTRHDETNILSALAARSLGYGKVAPKVDNHELGPVCLELGLEDAVFAEETLSSSFVDRVGSRSSSLAEMTLGKDWSLIRVVAREDHAGHSRDLPLPTRARLLTAGAKDAASRLCDGDATVEAGDSLVVLVHADEAQALRECFAPSSTTDQD
ncbi:MAG: TrkA family potassium uptake protein [Pseudomonadota bacterium]